LLTDREEMSDLHRGHSINASCHVSVNLAKRFQRRRFKQIGQLETRIACGVPCLVMVSDWFISKKSSPLKLPSQMHRNLVEPKPYMNPTKNLIEDIQ
jgi:hypothetical protein